ncbi:MAG: TonB-dependent receptor, partial [Pseudomonadota bacterium]|nr:TonB-dependent receptor [Pseudomonadota bacterium]
LRWGHVWTYDLENIFGIGPGNLFNTRGQYTGSVNLLQFEYPGENLGIPIIDPTAGLVAPLMSPGGWFPTGYDAPSLAVQNAYHPFVNEQTLTPKTQRITLYGDAAYELTDDVELFAEFLGNRRKTYQNSWRQFWTFGYTGDIYGEGGGGPGTFWADGWTGYNWLSPTGITNQADSSQKVDYLRGVGGLRGDFDLGFMKGWAFDTYVQYSRSKGVYRDQQILQDVYDISYFQSASCVGTVTPVSGKDCIDLPWLDPNFLAGQMTQEQTDFLFSWEKGRTKYNQLSFEGSVTGNLFELPAGPIGAAFGVTARRDKIHDRPGEITLAGNAWGATASGITAGHTNTMEAFGEVHVPIFKDTGLFQDLSLSGAARITNVKAKQAETGITDKNNGNWTYKVGANWTVSPWLRLRGSYGTSFRAPALFEQFKANETSFVNSRRIDPCVQTALNLERGNINQQIFDNCRAEGIPTNYAGASITATVFSQGGIGVLDPETSRAKTASIILTPNLRDIFPDTKLSLAVDYFDINVKGEISQLGASAIIRGCYSSEFFPDEPLCNLFGRGLAVDPFAIDNIQDKYVNIAQQQNRGVDLTGLVQQNIGRFGSINFLSQVTWQLKDTFALFAGTETDNNGEIGDPRWVGDFNLTWRAPGGWNLFWGMDVIGKSSNRRDFARANRDDTPGRTCISSEIRGEYCVDVSTPMTAYHSVSVTKELPVLKLEATLGIANLFDTTPPRTSTIGGTGIPALIGPVVGTSQYDFLGRRAFLNLSKTF